MPFRNQLTHCGKSKCSLSLIQRNKVSSKLSKISVLSVFIWKMRLNKKVGKKDRTLLKVKMAKKSPPRKNRSFVPAFYQTSNPSHIWLMKFAPTTKHFWLSTRNTNRKNNPIYISPVQLANSATTKE